ncbi:MAG: PIG-L family deacetylase [Pelagibacterales bacterium]|nr:PIG-L family deacetylase [Pelagibacterales bacterium]
MDILIISAHPDDEVIGMGGTLYKLSKQKHRIHLCVVTDGTGNNKPNTKEYEKISKLRREACIKSSNFLGIKSVDFLGLRDGYLDSIPQIEINESLEKLIKKYNPQIVYTTPKHDLHADHYKVYECTVVATRPHSNSVLRVLNYEFPTVQKSVFLPNVYVDISKEFTKKISAFKFHKTEQQKFPLPRSLQSIKNLAERRGIESNLKLAEGFNLIRDILK